MLTLVTACGDKEFPAQGLDKDPTRRFVSVWLMTSVLLCYYLVRFSQSSKTLEILALFSEMVLAESDIFQKVVIKGWGAEIFRKIVPSLILWEPFKDQAPSRTTVGNAAMKFIAP
jgi:hypothetical protein